MTSKLGFSMILAVAIAAVGCGSNEKTNAPTPGASNVTGATTTKANEFRFSTGKFEIPSGDSFECFYTDTVTDKQINVRSATATQGKGGHHITVYYAEQKQPVGHHPCVDVEMMALRQIAGATGGKEGVIELPPGYATKIPPGKQLVVQSHYVRTEPGTQTVEDEVILETLEEKDVKQFANAFVMVDLDFKLAPRAKGKSTSVCTVPKDLDVLLLLGHMHEWGSTYKLEEIDEKGNAISTLYETPWDPIFTSHPPINKYEPAQPMKFKKGMRLRQTCNWDNVEEHEMTFPREMCVMFSYYIPDDGFIQCDTKTLPNETAGGDK